MGRIPTMRMALCLCSAALMAAPAIALAQQSSIELAFDDCPGNSAASSARVDACASNLGRAMDLVASFIAPVDLTGVTIVRGKIGFFFSAGTIPDWWRLEPGGCRTGVSVSPGQVDPEGACADPWAGANVFASGQFSLVPEDPFPQPFPTPTHMLATVETAGDHSVNLQAGVKYQAFTLAVLRARSTGPGACAGCCIGACIYLQEIELVTASGSFVLADPFAGPNSALSWQNSQAHTPYGGCSGTSCPVPTLRGTWGQLKVLYR